MAAETMALKYYPREDNNGAIALGNILNVNSIIDHITIPGTNFVIKTLQKQYSDNELVTFNKVVLKISIAMHENNFANAYMLLTQFINNDFSSKFVFSRNTSLDDFIGETYMEYENEGTNKDDESIPIKIGTVHSVKGMTHCATMYVETFYHNHECKHLIKRGRNGEFQPSPFFNNTVNITSSRGKQAMKMLYVGLSRPTHLLCYASLKTNWSDEALHKMEAN